MEHAKNVLWGAYNNKTVMDGYAFPSRVKSLWATLSDIPHCVIFTASGMGAVLVEYLLYVWVEICMHVGAKLVLGSMCRPERMRAGAVFACGA